MEKPTASAHLHGLDLNSIEGFMPSGTKMDFKADPTCMWHPVSETPSAPAPAQAATEPLEACIEQAGKPRRFWRDGEGNEGQEKSIDKPVPPRQAAMAADQFTRSAGLTFDVTGAPKVTLGFPDDKSENEKQASAPKKTSRGWNLAAEAAASGKRIVPKTR